jgi:peptide deformylase
MTKLAILEYPDPRLRKTAERVEVVDDAVRQLAADLLETMYAANGVGLAATQVDVHRRVIVLDVSEERNQPMVFINPEVLKADGRGPGEEGCLSVPDVYDKVQRATHIRVRALGRDGAPFEMDAEGLLAVCIQHEMDHLEGKLFVDYLSELKRQLIRRRLEKERKQRSTGRDSQASARSVAAPAVATPSRPAL